MSVITTTKSQRGELYESALKKIRKGEKASAEDCPLNSPNIGLISENDHRVRMCLCPLCTCGKHICPSKAIQDPYPTSIYNSQYMANFDPKPRDQPILIKYQGNFFPSKPFDFETTNEDNYKPHSVNNTSNISKYSPSSPPKTAFYAKSSYANNFLN